MVFDWYFTTERIKDKLKNFGRSIKDNLEGLINKRSKIDIFEELNRKEQERRKLEEEKKRRLEEVKREKEKIRKKLFKYNISYHLPKYWKNLNDFITSLYNEGQTVDHMFLLMRYLSKYEVSSFMPDLNVKKINSVFYLINFNLNELKEIYSKTYKDLIRSGGKKALFVDDTIINYDYYPEAEDVFKRKEYNKIYNFILDLPHSLEELIINHLDDIKMEYRFYYPRDNYQRWNRENEDDYLKLDKKTFRLLEENKWRNILPIFLNYLENEGYSINERHYLILFPIYENIKRINKHIYEKLVPKNINKISEYSIYYFPDDLKRIVNINKFLYIYLYKDFLDLF